MTRTVVTWWLIRGPLGRHDQVAFSVSVGLFRIYDGKHYVDGKGYVTALTRTSGVTPGTVDLAERAALILLTPEEPHRRYVVPFQCSISVPGKAEPDRPRVTGDGLVRL